MVCYDVIHAYILNRNCTVQRHLMSKEFKPNAHVLARIAEAFSQNIAIKKTHLHSASRTDWNSFEKYMNWLQSKNYVVYHNANEYTYQLTGSGREMFNMIRNLHDQIKKFQSMINA